MTQMQTQMQSEFDVVIIGGSYAGLAAAMALGRALRSVLVIDGGQPCNAQTPYSHNLLTHDGQRPAEIAAAARSQVAAYDTVQFLDGEAADASGHNGAFEVRTDAGRRFTARKLIFATGIADIFPDVEGFAACWGISALHCPYCHGYEVRGRTTGVLADGAAGVEFARLLRNWTPDLTFFTHGQPPLSSDEAALLRGSGIDIVETPLARIEHADGQLRAVVLADGSRMALDVLYARLPFTQRSALPARLGCALTAQGYIEVDGAQRTTVDGVYASGDAVSNMRTLAHAVHSGTTAGMMVNKALVLGGGDVASAEAGTAAGAASGGR